jgi:hypothetical protein
LGLSRLRIKEEILTASGEAPNPFERSLPITSPHSIYSNYDIKDDIVKDFRLMKFRNSMKPHCQMKTEILTASGEAPNSFARTLPITSPHSIYSNYDIKDDIVKNMRLIK